VSQLKREVIGHEWISRFVSEWISRFVSEWKQLMLEVRCTRFVQTMTKCFGSKPTRSANCRLTHPRPAVNFNRGATIHVSNVSNNLDISKWAMHDLRPSCCKPLSFGKSTRVLVTTEQSS
jgi:hypothetical protein